MASREPAPLWLIDAYNVLRVSLSPEGDAVPWWTDERRQELIELCTGLAGAAEVHLVFDARHLASAEEAVGAETSAGQPRVFFAPSADDWIVAAVRDQAARHERRIVVTADRRLANRAKSRGAEVVSTQDFVERCRASPRRPAGCSEGGVG